MSWLNIFRQYKEVGKEKEWLRQKLIVLLNNNLISEVDYNEILELINQD